MKGLLKSADQCVGVIVFNSFFLTYLQKNSNSLHPAVDEDIRFIYVVSVKWINVSNTAVVSLGTVAEIIKSH